MRESKLERVSESRIRTYCRKCGTPILLDFARRDGTMMPYREAQDALRKLANRGPGECPGFHVELAGWEFFWSLNEALEMQYPDHDDLEPTDVEFIGVVVLD
jgi:hypothetical protein